MSVKDPWEHRSENMSCRTCMWYVTKKTTQPFNRGRCRRHAPTMSGYPVVFVSDWCGDHKLNEEDALQPKYPAGTRLEDETGEVFVVGDSGEIIYKEEA